MIHTIYTMTIGRYGQLDKTRDARLLRRWYNPLPVGLFKKRIDKLFNSVHEMGWGESGELFTEIDRAQMVNRMLQLSILYDALYSAMVIKAGIDIVLLMMDKDPQQVKNLDYFKEQVKELTGIDVKDIADIAKLRDEMTRMADKFAERFPDKEPEEGEQSTFTRGAMAVFSLMVMPYNDRMTLAEFDDLKKLADKKRKQLEKQLEKYGST